MTEWHLLPVFHFMFGVNLVIYGQLSNDKWVTTDTETWGILKHCVAYANQTLSEERKETCEYISAGDIPEYHKAMRRVIFLWCFLLYVVVLTGMMAPQIGICVILIYLGCAVTPPALLLTFYQDDDRWKDSDPSLGVGFWLFLALQIPQILMIIFFVHYYLYGDGQYIWCQTLSRSCCTPSCFRACWSRCTHCASDCCGMMRGCCTRCKESVTACCARWKERLSACCMRCKESVTACYTRCAQAVVTCGRSCSEGISSCCQRLGGKGRLLLQGLAGLLAACCAPCRRGPTKAAGRPSREDKQRRPHKQRVVLSQEQVWVLLKALAHSKAAGREQTTAQCYRGDKAEVSQDVGCNAGHSPQLGHNPTNTASGTKPIWGRRGTEDPWDDIQCCKLQQKLCHSACTTKAEMDRRHVERQRNRDTLSGSEQKIWHTESGTKPSWDGRGAQDQWNNAQYAKPEQKPLHTGGCTKPETDRRDVERQSNMNPETNQKFLNSAEPEWYPRDIERQWKRDQYPKAEQRLWHTESGTKPECDRPSLSGLPDYRVIWMQPDDMSECFV